MFLATVNSGTLLIALPDVERALGTSLLTLVWVILAYMVASTVLDAAGRAPGRPVRPPPPLRGGHGGLHDRLARGRASPARGRRSSFGGSCRGSGARSSSRTRGRWSQTRSRARSSAWRWAPTRWSPRSAWSSGRCRRGPWHRLRHADDAPEHRRGDLDRADAHDRDRGRARPTLLFSIFSGLTTGLSRDKLDPFMEGMHLALWILVAFSLAGAAVSALRGRRPPPRPRAPLGGARVMASPYPHIACCIDQSEASGRALAEARRLRAFGAGRLSLVHVLEAPAPGHGAARGRRRAHRDPGGLAALARRAAPPRATTSTPSSSTSSSRPRPSASGPPGSARTSSSPRPSASRASDCSTAPSPATWPTTPPARCS